MAEMLRATIFVLLAAAFTWANDDMRALAAFVCLMLAALVLLKAFGEWLTHH